MYFTKLPDHTVPGFDEQAHFDRFKKHNIIFHAESSHSNCERHVGCLSFKTVLKGQEIYRFGHQQVAVRPGAFLILNDEQEYASRIAKGDSTKLLSVFFSRDFALSALLNASQSESTLLDDPNRSGDEMPEFFQTLHPIDDRLQVQINQLITSLNVAGYDKWMVDEKLVFLLNQLIDTQKAHHRRVETVYASKVATRKEIYRRLCIARDFMHYACNQNPDLNVVSQAACLSVPQLVRQFKAVFGVTTHQYLTRLRLGRAAELLKLTNLPIHEIAWQCGFEDISAFSRAFKNEYAQQPANYRKSL